MSGPIDHLIVVGAGFSSNVGLPVASEFTGKLLDVTGLKRDGPSAILVQAMRKFVDDVFGGGANLGPDQWPFLEDLFTTIDLSANTGHNLGKEYSASDLRTIRRALIMRLIRMLSIEFRRKQRSPDTRYYNTVDMLAKIDVKRVAFLSLNWDTVIEETIIERQGPHSVDYGCNAVAADFIKGHVSLKRGRPPEKTLHVLKPHGSANWMYCDSCSELYWFPTNSTEKIADRLFRDSDAVIVKRLTGQNALGGRKPSLCPGCRAAALGTRFATFSYRKALEFPMHLATWGRAEELLQKSKTWIFIGYSLPAADYQFKHLLKRVQLSRSNKPRIILITGGSSGLTISNYQRFFGSDAVPIRRIFSGGMDNSAIACLKKLGVCAP